MVRFICSYYFKQYKWAKVECNAFEKQFKRENLIITSENSVSKRTKFSDMRLMRMFKLQELQGMKNRSSYL